MKPGISTGTTSTLAAVCRQIVLLLLVCGANPGRAGEPALGIILSEDGFKYRAVAKQIVQELQPLHPIKTISIDAAQIAQQSATLADSSMLLSLGSAGAEAALRHRGDKPVLCALISESAFHAILLRHFNSIEAGLQAGVSALYLDQPEQRLYQLAHLISPTAQRVGTALGPNLQSRSTALQAHARSVGLELQTVLVESDRNPVKLLDPLMQSIDMLVVMPDTPEWNNNTAKWLLYLAYRRAKPVIGFSRRYTEAGAVASLYTDTDDVVTETAAIAAQLLDNPVPGSIYWPQRFTISTNHTVARKLQLTLREEQYYVRNIVALEGAQ